jgi:ribosomal protein L37AE/L43A
MCPECGSDDIDLAEDSAYLWECQECGAIFDEFWEDD